MSNDTICNNEEHLKWIDEIKAQQIFCEAHSGAPKYTGKKFRRCPFCKDKNTKIGKINHIIVAKRFVNEIIEQIDIVFDFNDGINDMVSEQLEAIKEMADLVRKHLEQLEGR